MSKHSNLILQLYLTRKASKEAREEFQRVSQKVGYCLRSPNHQECYTSFVLSRDEWCDVCKVRQPLYIASRKASVKQGVALKAILSEGKADYLRKEES